MVGHTPDSKQDKMRAAKNVEIKSEFTGINANQNRHVMDAGNAVRPYNMTIECNV